MPEPASIVVGLVAAGLAVVAFVWRHRSKAVQATVESREPLRVGDRVYIYGGYDCDPEWLNGADGRAGVIERFISGQNAEPAAVIRTDEAVTVGHVTADLLVMELRWVGATWVSGAVAHMELCDFEPAAGPWQKRERGAWVESHASIRKLG